MRFYRAIKWFVLGVLYDLGIWRLRPVAGGAALAVDRSTESRPIDIKSYPVATATTIFRGSMVCLNASGFLVPAADTATLSGVVGVADEQVVNAGANGAKSCRVSSGKAYRFAATSITQAMVGKMMYVIDDQTFDDVAAAFEVPCGILIEFISTTSGWIYIPNDGVPTALAGAQLGTGIIRFELVAGQDETGDTTIPVTGMVAGDELIFFGRFVTAAAIASFAARALTDFTVGAGELTVVANAANNTNNQYFIIWIDHT